MRPSILPVAGACKSIGVKLRGVLALEGRVKSLDGQHISVDVAAGVKQRPQAGDLAAVVQVRHHDRHLSGLRDVVEAGFPVTRLAAGAFGWHDKLQCAGGFVDGLCRGRHQVVGLGAVHRNATEPAHQATKWKSKDARLGHPVHVQPQHKRHHQHVRQVPVTGVRRDDENAATRLKRQAAQHLPASHLENHHRQSAKHPVDDGCGEDGAMHGYGYMKKRGEPPQRDGSPQTLDYSPAASRRTAALSVRSQVNSGSSRPKWP